MVPDSDQVADILAGDHREARKPRASRILTDIRPVTAAVSASKASLLRWVSTGAADWILTQERDDQREHGEA